jgi:hypothetical protein
MIVALIALFISLGGASYAVVTLPAHSVGPRQLQRGAVTLSALGFPLGAMSVTKAHPEDLVKGGCNGGGFSGNVAPPCTPPIGFRGSSPTQLRVSAHRLGRLLISVIAGIGDEGAAGTHAEVTYAAMLDGRPVSQGAITIMGGQKEQVPVQALGAVTSGVHTVGFQTRAEYFSTGPGDVVVAPVSLIVVLLP